MSSPKPIPLYDHWSKLSAWHPDIKETVKVSILPGAGTFLVKTGEVLSSVCKLHWSKTEKACVDTGTIGQSPRKARRNHRNHEASQGFIYHGTIKAKTNYFPEKKDRPSQHLSCICFLS